LLILLGFVGVRLVKDWRALLPNVANPRDRDRAITLLLRTEELIMKQFDRKDNAVGKSEMESTRIRQDLWEMKSPKMDKV
jgi:hypothetical protein